MLLSLAPQPTFDSLMLSAIASADESETVTARTQRLVIDLFRTEARSLVRLARLFVDDRDAAEDIVQEAFLRLARSATRIQDESKAPAYLRSIVLNLARDHNRRGLVSLRHHATAGREIEVASPLEEQLVRDQQHHAVLEAVRSLPTRQRDCVTLRYFEELGIDAIAAVLKVSPNSVKTHLRRGMAALGHALEAEHDHA
jgi:RNA polymerase sigma factor (sigma-70 family)